MSVLQGPVDNVDVQVALDLHVSAPPSVIAEVIELRHRFEINATK
jgi:hypothetical protein